MRFEPELCIGCGNCLLYCPIQAISLEDGKLNINRNECVECHNCVRANVCPTEVFNYSSPPWPRTLRATFSDPFFKHESTQHLGRGTEEVKTNDVTHLVKSGEVGLAVEAGRPGVSATFKDVEIITKTLANFSVYYPVSTPIRSLIQDESTGTLRPEILDEKVLSVIVECRLPLDELNSVLDVLQKIIKDVKTTVYCIGVFALEGEIDVEKHIPAGLQISAAGKNNMGLGRSLREAK